MENLQIPPQRNIPLIEAASRVRAAVDAARRGLVDREVLVELVALAAIAGEHLLIIGPPGTAKSAAVRRVSAALGGRYFEYLLGRFTEPSEIFGPVDLRRLQEGVVETATDGMLPEAELAFLDEVFQGSTAILNTLLGILNERRFRRGKTVVSCPLRLAVGASNSLPEEPSLAAFADRFLLRQWVEPVADPLLEDLLSEGWGLSLDPLEAVADVGDLDVLTQTARGADLHQARPLLARALRQLRSEGIAVSDRRAVKCQALLAAAAVLDGRKRADERDLWPVVYAMPDSASQTAARETLHTLLGGSLNNALSAAAEDASRGPQARAQRLTAAGEVLLTAGPGDDATGWRLRLEGIAREIDAGFSAENRPESVAALYGRVREILVPGEAVGGEGDASP